MSTCTRCGKWNGAHATLPGQPTDRLCMCQAVATRTEFEAAALPPLPAAFYYWTPTTESGFSQRLSTWSQNPGPHPSWDVQPYYTADQMLKFRAEGIAAHTAQTDRERFEAAAYRWLLERARHLHNEAWIPTFTAKKEGPCDIFSADEVQPLIDTAIAAAMGWPSVLENGG